MRRGGGGGGGGVGVLLVSHEYYDQLSQLRDLTGETQRNSKQNH